MLCFLVLCCVVLFLFCCVVLLVLWLLCFVLCCVVLSCFVFVLYIFVYVLNFPVRRFLVPLTDVTSPLHRGGEMENKFIPEGMFVLSFDCLRVGCPVFFYCSVLVSWLSCLVS